MNPTVHTAQVLPPRALLFLAIVAIHAVLAYFLTSGLMNATLHILTPPPVTAEFLKEPDKPAPRPLIAEPRLDIPTVVTVPPVIDEIVPPVDPSPTPLVAETFTDPVPMTPVQPMKAQEPPVRLIGRNVMPNTEEYYPAHEKRMGLEGIAVVRACVDERGKLDGAPTVEESSGKAAFDSAALRVAKDGRYARAVRGDTPVPNCYRFRVNFSMNER